MLRRSLRYAVGIAVLSSSVGAQATSVSWALNDWKTNENGSGNYQIIIDNIGTSTWDFYLTVDPWNAEAIGFGLELGDIDLGALTLSNVTPLDSIKMYVNTEDLSPKPILNSMENLIDGMAKDNEWELLFALGNKGWDGIQTFSWSVTGVALAEIALNDVPWLAAVRAQQYCSGDSLNTGNGEGTNCGGSDKSWAYGEGDITTTPLPAAAWLFGTALAGIAGLRARRRKSKAA